MPDEIKQVLESFIGQEEQILNRHSQAQSKRDDPRAHLKGEAFNLLTRETLGSRGSRIVRSLIELSDRQTRNSLEADSETAHRRILNQARSFLGTISEWRKHLKEPNSDRLVSRLEGAQTGVRVTTRIRATIKLLKSLKSKRLVYNKDIHLIEEKGVILPPRSPFSGRLELMKILSSVREYVKICDTWVDIETLEVLLSVPSNVSIMLLTGDSGKSKKFQSASKAFKVERQLYEMRVGQGLHDRFIISKNRGWLLGSSIKDFGKKFSAVTPLPEKDAKETENIYDDLWKNAQDLIV